MLVSHTTPIPTTAAQWVLAITSLVRQSQCAWESTRVTRFPDLNSDLCSPTDLRMPGLLASVQASQEKPQEV